MKKGTMKKLAVILTSVLLTSSFSAMLPAAEDAGVSVSEETVLLTGEEIVAGDAGEMIVPAAGENEVIDFEEQETPALTTDDDTLAMEDLADDFLEDEPLTDPAAGDDLLLIDEEIPEAAEEESLTEDELSEDVLSEDELPEDEADAEALPGEEVLAEDELSEEMTEEGLLLQAGPTPDELSKQLWYTYEGETVKKQVTGNTLYINQIKGDLNVYVLKQNLKNLYNGYDVTQVEFRYYTKDNEVVSGMLSPPDTTPDAEGYFSDYLPKGTVYSYDVKYFKFSVTYKDSSNVTYIKESAPFTVKDFGNIGNDSWHDYGNVTWEYDRDKNEITISGSGEMIEDHTSDQMKAIRNYFKSRHTYDDLDIPPAKVVFKPGVTSIAPYLFWNTGATDVILPTTGLTKIEEGAFCFANLKTIVVPDSVTEIGTSAFKSAVLESLKLPSKLTEIPDEMCDHSEALKSVTIPDGVTKIGDKAFRYCIALTSIQLPSKLKEIGEDAFADCMTLKSITIPEHVTKIGAGAFSGCDVLEKVTLPKDLKEIGEFAFWASPKLQEVIIPEGTTTIGRKAFFGCAGLKKIVIPASVKTIGEDVFKDANKDLVIVTPDGSAAAVYAKSHGIKCVVDQLQKLEKTILSKKDIKNVSGAVFNKMKVRAAQVGPKYVQLKWTRVKGATYNIYGALRTGTFKKIATVAKGKNSYKHPGLKKNKFYKYIVVAYDASSDAKTIKSISPTIVVPTAGGTYRKIASVSINKGNSTIKKNKTLKITAKAQAKAGSGKQLKIYRKVQYESSNKNIATVGAIGKITAKNKGSCFIFAYAQDGTFKKIKITVK